VGGAGVEGGGRITLAAKGRRATWGPGLNTFEDDSLLVFWQLLQFSGTSCPWAAAIFVCAVGSDVHTAELGATIDSRDTKNQ